MGISSDSEPTAISLHEETIEVGRRRRVIGSVTVKAETYEAEELIDELLAQEHAEIERVSIQQPVDTVPEVRQEGDTIIVPIVEEVVIVERRLMLREEVRIRRVRDTERHYEKVPVRKQRVVIMRVPSGDTATE